MNRDRIFVRHMIDAISEIENILSGLTYSAFVNDAIRMHACVRLLEILGEAANKLSPEFQNKHTSIPFSDIIGMRHKLIHHYFEVDLEVLWKTYETDLPDLKIALMAAIDEEIG
jgi:uncharacterized protein with HEPN domain